jgi:hypothetical protein
VRNTTFCKNSLKAYKDDHTFKNYDPLKFYDARSLPFAEILYNYNGREIRIAHAEGGEVEEVFLHYG